MDGTGSIDAIGAAAILYLNGNTHAELKYRLGSAKQHIAFEGELTGILGLHLARTMQNGHDSINTSSTTKRATIKSLQNNRSQPDREQNTQTKENAHSSTRDAPNKSNIPGLPRVRF